MAGVGLHLNPLSSKARAGTPRAIRQRGRGPGREGTTELTELRAGDQGPQLPLGFSALPLHFPGPVSRGGKNLLQIRFLQYPECNCTQLRSTQSIFSTLSCITYSCEPVCELSLCLVSAPRVTGRDGCVSPFGQGRLSPGPAQPLHTKGPVNKYTEELPHPGP